MLFATYFIHIINFHSYQWLGFNIQVKKAVLSKFYQSEKISLWAASLAYVWPSHKQINTAINALPHLKYVKYDNEAARRFKIVTIRQELMSDKYHPPVHLVSHIRQPDLLCFWPDFLVEVHDSAILNDSFLTQYCHYFRMTDVSCWRLDLFAIIFIWHLFASEAGLSSFVDEGRQMGRLTPVLSHIAPTAHVVGLIYRGLRKWNPRRCPPSVIFHRTKDEAQAMRLNLRDLYNSLSFICS